MLLFCARDFNFLRLKRNVEWELYRENHDIVLTFWDHVFWAESLFNGEKMENISIQSNKKKDLLRSWSSAGLIQLN